nr:4-hydroxythreonine-4-phosphate dehydrogenase PdxA [Maliibacterium massiliense]
MMDKPRLGITMGDAAGIGPEIIVRALEQPCVWEACHPVVVADARAMARALAQTGSALAMVTADAPKDLVYVPGTLPVADIACFDEGLPAQGVVSARAGAGAYSAIAHAIDWALSGALDACVTAPLNKQALHASGCPYPGHTEIFTALCHAQDTCMMLAEGQLRVAHVSTHRSLRAACDAVQKARVVRVAELLFDACRALGVSHPHLAVAGLNPHAGEDGLFGDEEIKQIAPAVAALRAGGMDVEGPIPPDTVFAAALGGKYDGVVAMYHDQGHIPVKVAGFTYDQAAGGFGGVRGVNITLGLPIIRTSVDHGTAFDVAGKGVASSESLVEAIGYAARMAACKAQVKPIE